MMSDIYKNPESNTIKLKSKKNQYHLTILPEKFINWQLSERKKLYDFMQYGNRPDFLSSHLPSVITVNKDDMNFPVNAACKGIGLIPRDEEIINISNKIEILLKELKNKDFLGTLELRIKGAKTLYNDINKINRTALGGLEIFETKTYHNILKNPFVSIFFVGESPTYPSYQINCIAEIFDSSHPFYKFMINMRSLFEEARFHYQQLVYPYAIRYHVIDVLDKSLQLRKTKENKQ